MDLNFKEWLLLIEVSELGNRVEDAYKQYQSNPSKSNMDVLLGHVAYLARIHCLRSCRNICYGSSEADDFAQDILLKTWNQIQKSPLDSLYNWLGYVMRNHCINQGRDNSNTKKKMYGKFKSEIDPGIRMGRSGKSIERTQIEEPKIKTEVDLEDIFKLVNDDVRQYIKLRMEQDPKEDKGFEIIAGKMGRPVGTIKRFSHIAKRAVKVVRGIKEDKSDEEIIMDIHPEFYKKITKVYPALATIPIWDKENIKTIWPKRVGMLVEKIAESLGETIPTVLGWFQSILQIQNWIEQMKSMV